MSISVSAKMLLPACSKELLLWNYVVFQFPKRISCKSVLLIKAYVAMVLCQDHKTTFGFDDTQKVR